MARFTFGGEVTHIGVQEDAGNANAFKRLPAGSSLPWRATPGGSVVTDFRLWDGSGYTIVATAIVSDANGYAPPFQGPDAVSVLYDPNGYALVARDAYLGSGVGVTDGDKGDITVSASGTVWNIDANSVTASELAAASVGTSELIDGSVLQVKLGTLTASVISDLTETIQDRLNTDIVDGAGITTTYDDTAGTLTIGATASDNVLRYTGSAWPARTTKTVDATKTIFYLSATTGASTPTDFVDGVDVWIRRG